MKDDLLINISTENGTGSQTANKILTRSLLLGGYHVSSKNLFPSNIAGLPTNYKIRISSKSFKSFSKIDSTDIFIAFNKKTLDNDLKNLSSDTRVIINKDFKYQDSNNKINLLELPCRSLTKELHSSVSTRKLLYNMLYVGATLKALGLELKFGKEALENTLSHLREELKQANVNALSVGYENSFDKPVFLLQRPDSNPQKAIIDGNSAMALGFLDGGAQVFTWYPITPSTSVAETFESMTQTLDTKRAVLQCEDELSAVTATLGAGWAGARSVTATSGPGLSLMQESIGLGYFTETPFVVADVQRAGPSTGLPTRTAQGDLILCYYSSHGDTIHPILIPSNPQEAYGDSFASLNLAQDLQTPVFILSDLDLGMNEWSTSEIVQDKSTPSVGELQIDSASDFKRFSNESLVPKRSLPRLSDSSTAYFTRGSGHDEYGRYTEDPDAYNDKLLRLKNKILRGRSVSSFFPKDEINESKSKEYSLVYFGTTAQIKDELLSLLNEYDFSTYQIRSLPFQDDLKNFLNQHKVNFVLEQNRDGQMARIIRSEIESNTLIKSCTHFNGLPADPKGFYNQIIKGLKK